MSPDWSISINNKEYLELAFTGKESNIYIHSKAVKIALFKKIEAYIKKNRNTLLNGENKVFKPKIGLEDVRFEKI